MAAESTDDTWSAKEVFADLKGDLTAHLDKQDVTLHEIKLDLSGKADRADVVALSVKIDGHGTRISKLEEHRLDVDASKKFRNRAWAVAGTVGGILAIVAGSLIAALVH